MKIPIVMKRNDLITFLSSLSLSIVITLFVSNTLHAKTEVLFSPKGSIKDTILKTIISSEETIDIAAFTFTAGDIAEALYNAKERGVKIRIIIDQRQDKMRYPVLEFLKEEGFDLQFLKGNIGGSMNNSFAIFDGKLLVTGSYNWTEYAEKFNYENAIFIDESEVIGKYKKEYESLYDESIVQGVRRLEQTEPHTAQSGAGIVSGLSRNGSQSVPENVSKEKEEGEKDVISDDNIAASFAGKGARHITTLEDKKQVKKESELQELFLNITFIEFDKIFGNESELKMSEKKRLWKDKFEGKYVRWTGRVGYKGIAVYDWNKVGIRHKDSNIDVNLRFDYTKQKKVLRLNVGDVITYTGKLVSLRGLFSQYRLDDVDVLQVR
jgi:hypothetical protein